MDLAALERDHSVQTILGIKATNDTQVLKQPDVLMLLYLLPDEFDEATRCGPTGTTILPALTSPAHRWHPASRRSSPAASTMRALAYHFYRQAALLTSTISASTPSTASTARSRRGMAGSRLWLWRLAPDGPRDQRNRGSRRTGGGCAAVRSRGEQREFVFVAL